MKRVPYALLARAEGDARERFPDATRVRALWTPASACEVHVEVWRGDSATVHGYRTVGN
jgi:hypothetical protein